MANYNYTAKASFRPFTFDEMLRPLAMYTQEYNTIQDSLGELNTKASIFDKLANEQTDSRAYSLYKSYSNDLKSMAESLAKKGLTPESRQGLINMKRRYSSDIVPLEQAYNKRNKLSEEQRKLLANNPTIMFDRNFSTISLDELLDNPELSYTLVSGDDLYKRGKEAATSAASRFIEVSSALQNQYWKIKQGYGSEAANRFLLDQSNIPELKDAINRIVSQSGVTQNNLNKAIDYTISGIMAGMSYDEKYQANRGYIDQAERERLDLSKEQFEWTKDKWEDEQLGVKLPNGNRVKDVGGGRVRVTYPDGKVEIMAAPKSTDNTKGLNKDKKAFPGLQFKMWNDSKAVNEFQEGLSNTWSYKRKGFTTSDEQLISPSDLSPAMQTNLLSKLSEYGLTFDDIEIWKDEDTATDNHYQVRLKQNKESDTSNIINEFGEL